MALGILNWDLPPPEQMGAYLEKARTKWIPTVLKQPGVKQFCAYRNPFKTTPEVVIHTEFDSLASWLKWIESEDYSVIVADIRAAGCTNLSAQILDASPVVPEPIKPPGG